MAINFFLSHVIQSNEGHSENAGRKVFALCLEDGNYYAGYYLRPAADGHVIVWAANYETSETDEVLWLEDALQRGREVDVRLRDLDLHFTRVIVEEVTNEGDIVCRTWDLRTHRVPFDAVRMRSPDHHADPSIGLRTFASAVMASDRFISKAV